MNNPNAAYVSQAMPESMEFVKKLSSVFPIKPGMGLLVSAIKDMSMTQF